MHYKFSIYRLHQLILVFVIASSTLNISLAQENNIANHENIWANISGTYKISKKLSISSLYSFRRNNYFDEWQQSLLRTKVIYKSNSDFWFGAGYDWVITFPYGKQPISSEIAENRFFFHSTIKQKIDKFHIKHRYRWELRFINRKSSYRFRYRLSIKHPIIKIKKKNFSLLIQNEFFINLKENIHKHVFDQNWMFTGVSYPLSKKVSSYIGYMNQYIIKQDQYHVEKNHVINLGINFQIE